MRPYVVWLTIWVGVEVGGRRVDARVGGAGVAVITFVVGGVSETSIDVATKYAAREPTTRRTATTRAVVFLDRVSMICLGLVAPRIRFILDPWTLAESSVTLD